MTPDSSISAEQLISVQARFKSSEERFRLLFDNLGDEVHLWKTIRDENGSILT